MPSLLTAKLVATSASRSAALGWSLVFRGIGSFDGDGVKRIYAADAFAVDQHVQALAEFVTVAILIPHDTDQVASVGNIVESEVVPVRRRERVDLQRIIVTGHETGEARNHEIAVTRMQVVFGMVVAVVAFK